MSYADDDEPDIWKGGYEIIELPIGLSRTAVCDQEHQCVVGGSRNTDR